MKSESSIPPRYVRKSPFVRSLFNFLLLLVVVISVIWLSFLQFRTPDIIPENEKKDKFSAMRALDSLEDFAVKPHPVGSIEHNRVRDYIMDILGELGVPPKIQKMDSVQSAWDNSYTGNIENIVARIPGEHSTGAIMISAHYDTVDGSPGAADDGSGVASILETVRILSESSSLKNDVIILITDGEEIGLLGAKAFVNHHPWAKDVRIVLNFEARGNEGPSILVETSEINGTLISEFLKGTTNPIAYSFIFDLYKTMPNDTDLTVFKNAGMYGLNFAFFGGLNNYHSANDSIEELSLKSLQHQGDNMLHLVRHFGNINLIDPKPDKKVYFNVFKNKIVHYSQKLVLPLMFLIITAYVVTFIHGYRSKKFSLKGLCLGLLVFILTIIFAYLIGLLIWKLLSMSFPESIWAIKTVTSLSHPVLAFSIFIVFTSLFIIYRITSKKINFFNLTMGAYTIWLFLLVISSLLLKGSSYIFAWPLLFGLIGLNILIRLKNKNYLVGSIIALIFAVPSILITVPALYIVYILLSLSILDILLVFVALIGAFIIPSIALPEKGKQEFLVSNRALKA